MEPITLTSEEYKRLRLQARRAIGRVSERIHYVLLFSRGFRPSEIAALYQIDERTIATWLERFRERGVEGLDDLPRSGRPCLASAVAQQEAERCLDTSPIECGFERTTWTRKLLRWPCIASFVILMIMLSAFVALPIPTETVTQSPALLVVLWVRN